MGGASSISSRAMVDSSVRSGAMAGAAQAPNLTASRPGPHASTRRTRHRVPESALNRPVRSYGRVKLPIGVATVKSPTTR